MWLSILFEGTNLKPIIFYTDGGCRKNPGPAAGAVYFPATGLGLGKSLGRRTNNEAEMDALIMGLDYTRAHDYTHLGIYTDSQLVAHLVTGKWRANSQNLWKLLQDVKDRLTYFTDWTVTWIPREQNQPADWLCNQVLDAEEKGEPVLLPTLFEIPSSVH